jgi:choline monooxygenase
LERESSAVPPFDIQTVVKEALSRVARPIDDAESAPAAFYTDPSVFDLERAALFNRGWLFVGRADQVSALGSYRAVDTPAGPVLLTRDRDGELRAFANLCRHRGSILAEGEGPCRRLVCPYHGWSYHLDGRLSGAPDMGDVTGFESKEHGLAPFRLEAWGGFLFVNADPAAAPLAEMLGDLPDRMATHRPDALRHVWSITLDCACNWKLILENAIETYHTGLVHRDTVGAQTSRDIETRGDWLAIQVLSDRSIATLPDAPPAFPPIEGLDADARRGTYFTLLPPTCQLVFAQDCAWWLNTIPLAADRTLLEIGGCFPKDCLDLADFNDRAAPYIERWEAVGREDVGILERQQRALSSPLHKPGRLSRRDAQVRAFDEWVLRALSAHATA